MRRCCKYAVLLSAAVWLAGCSGARLGSDRGRCR
jgi:hypothetical protein